MSKKINYSDILSLKQSIVYIVGGKGLIGKEITRAISSNDAKTIVLDINNKGSKQFGNIININFDSSNLEDIEDKFNSIIKEFGCPDVYINCSYPKTSDWRKNTFSDVSLKSYRQNIEIHLNSYSWLARLAAEAMVRSCVEGSIVQLGSIYGILGQDLTVYEGTKMKENISYSIIKGGITNLTRQMASYYGKKGIRVNTVSPGGVYDVSQSKKFIKQYSNKVPLGRLADPSEIASAVLFLASNASSYITGSNLIIDGGWSII